MNASAPPRSRSSLRAVRRRRALGAGLAACVAPAVPAEPASTPDRDALRVEPPNWWVGFREPRLMLLIEGPGVAACRPVLAAPGVRVTGHRPGDHPDALFVHLHIGPQARAGTWRLRLLDAQGSARHALDYPVWPRAKGSAARVGFGPQDAVYLVVPDRFAQGRRPAPPAEPEVDLSDAVDRRQPLARHGGNLAGLRMRLDYIADMGFTQLWCTPVVENAMPSMSYHGYAPTDLYRIDPRLGDNAEYRELVAEARTRGIGVIHDIVLNHIGDRHRWMRRPPTRDWINPRRLTNNAHISVQDPHAAEGDRRAMVDGWFVDSMPDLNTRQPLLAEYLIQNTIWWIEYAGLSGIREDTYPYADKGMLKQWGERVLREYPRLTLVGEEMSDHAPQVAYWQRGQRNHDGYASPMPSMMDFPLVAAMRKALREEEGRDGEMKGWFDLYQALGFDFVYPQASMLMLFDGNHDTTRVLAELDGDLDLARMALALVATLPRIPQFFYGTEIALRGPKPRDDGRLRMDFPGGFPGDTVDGFRGDGLAPEARELQAWLRTLLRWRREQPVLHGGRMMQFMPEDGCYVYGRYRDDRRERVLVLLNKNRSVHRLEPARFAEFVQGRVQGVDVHTGALHRLDALLSLPPRSVTVLGLVG